MLEKQQPASEIGQDFIKGDIEEHASKIVVQDVAQGESINFFGPAFFWQKLANYGVELRGVEPVPEVERTDTKFINIGTWLGAAMLCLLP